MLALGRKEGEVIVIGDLVRVKVVKIMGNKVILGIDAPMTIPVHRLEVHEALCREEKKTTEGDDD